MSFDAKIVEHSISPLGKELVTYQLRYPRFIHAELMTHRVLGRNASSSRAIPVQKMISTTLADPAFFVHIGKNQPGMQANEEVDDHIKATFEQEWKELAHIVAGYVERWSTTYGIHKQVANRALEPWQHISVIVTATEWDGFFKLRRHKDAQPEFQKLANLMWEAKQRSRPVWRPIDRETEAAWHLPYVTQRERWEFEDKPRFLAKLSVARCARVSFLNHDGTVPHIDKDLALFERLIVQDPAHASPTEHQGYPLPSKDGASRNLRGWRQHREILEV